jgi:hypothetical protein
MTMNGSMEVYAFEVFIQKCLLPQLWVGAVVVMDNVPSHKLASIIMLIYIQLLIFNFYTYLKDYANHTYFEPRSRNR